jgi:choline monooxygenase
MEATLEQILSSYDDRAPLEQAFTIPASWYVDPRIAELERLNVFSKTWQLVARTDQVANPGDFVSTRVAGEPTVVVRGSDGELRAFLISIQMQLLCTNFSVD